MNLGFTPEQEMFRRQAAAWLEQQLSGPFKHVRGLHSLTAMPDARKEWELALGAARWSVIGWPESFGGRGATLTEQVIFAEEYARAGAPPRLNHLGAELVGPTLLAIGSERQRQRFLPAIAAGEEIWCQGYSEPNAGSDLANVRTSARLEGEQWIIDGQKVWTSLAQFSDWCLLIARTQPDSRGREGLSCLLVPMRQKGIVVKPIRQITGEYEFNEVFFDGASTAAENIVGAPGEGWKAAMVTLSFERGVSTLAQQMQFRNELDALIEIAKRNGSARDPLIQQRLAEAHIGLKVMRYSALRMLTSAERGALSQAAYTYKIYWATWHRQLGELAAEILGAAGEIAAEPYELDALSKLFLYTRADTIYAGTNEIQRNIIAERALGLPKESRGASR